MPMTTTLDRRRPTRREALAGSAKVALLLLSAGVLPGVARAQAAGYNQAAFDAKAIGEALKALGVGSPVASADVTLTAPDIAENGAVVPVGASTVLPGVKRIALLVEKNPSVLSAVFDVNEMIDASFSTRVKMGQSSDVYAVALMNDGRVLYAKKEVKVTLGGCGG
ncbi:MAG TPA: thiosulfate oxidation carrier protein SoxY [Burkholderiaceae bacterium]